MKIRLALILYLLLIGCATTPPHEMQNENSSSVAINVSIKYLALPFLYDYYSPDLVYFVKLENDVNNLLTQSHILVSNYYNDYGAFILNVEPGKYMAIAAHYKSRNKGRNYNVIFPKNVMQSTMIDVRPGSFEYMGNIELDQQPIFTLSNKADNFDDVQSHFYDLLVPLKMPSVVSLLLTNAYYANSSLISLVKNNDEFIKNQRMYFKDTKWQPKMIQK